MDMLNSNKIIESLPGFCKNQESDSGENETYRMIL